MAKSRKKEARKAKGKAVEVKFFKIAILVTVVLIALLYYVFIHTS